MGVIENDLSEDTYIGLELPLTHTQEGYFKRTKTALEQAKSNIKNLYEVELSDGTFFYIDDQGDHIFLGDLFRIENNRLVNLSYVREKEKLLKLLNEIDRNSLITFDSPKKKYEVFIIALNLSISCFDEPLVKQVWE